MGARAVFLVGFMASGKSTIGLELAQRLGWQFVDLDSHIEARERQVIPDIFRKRGEPGFRRAETEALRDLIHNLQHDSVIALGGGAFVQLENRELLRPWPTVFLEVPVDELWRRSFTDASVRPLAKNRTQFTLLYAERLPFYRQATLAVETTGKSPTTICAEIDGRLQLSEGESSHSQNPANPSGPETGEPR